ncbi:MAG: hypothetical protein EKK41_23230 [Hyphomicrobiales bacterium]|nr:MAG: hypothetical protein EKK41_23230 [Hyphomicrobiales bacterium]
MSDTMIERVAKAIYAEASRQGAGHGNFDILYAEVQDGLRLMARAAIEAMREPSPALILEATDCGRRKLGNGDFWRAIIDAALQPATDSEAAK